MLVNVRWFYRPEVVVFEKDTFLTACRRSCTGGRRGTARWRQIASNARIWSLAQVMESDHKDTVSVLTINSKCKVHTLEEYLAIPKPTRDNPAEQLIPVPSLTATPRH